jgi:hypothetical protein
MLVLAKALVPADSFGAANLVTRTIGAVCYGSSSTTDALP